MVTEIQLDGTGWARGRNGYFVPRRLDCFGDITGMVNLSAASRRGAKTDPIVLTVTRPEALSLSRALVAQAGLEPKTRIVLFVEKGMVTGILADHPTQALLVDCDVEGKNQEGLDLVSWNGREKWANVRPWGEAEVFSQKVQGFYDKNKRGKQ